MSIPHHALTDVELKKYAQALNLLNFRGVYMRNNLPKKIRKRESGIINLDNRTGPGTHWTAYNKNNITVDYFDSYGDLRPPIEVMKYFMSDGGNNIVRYNYQRYQKEDQTNCGQLALYFLYSLNTK